MAGRRRGDKQLLVLSLFFGPLSTADLGVSVSLPLELGTQALLGMGPKDPLGRICTSALGVLSPPQAAFYREIRRKTNE